MQVSRCLRCFRGDRSLKALQFFRRCQDVVNNSCHHSQLQPSALFLSYCRRQSSLSSSGNETLMSSDSSVQEAANLKEKWTKIFQDTASSEDGFDISEIEAEISKSKRTNIQHLLSECCSKFEKANDNRKVQIMNLIQPQLSNAVDMTLKDTSLLEMRLQCLRLLLWQDEDSVLTKKILDHTVKNAQYFSIKVVADIVHLLSVSPSTELRSKSRRDLILVTVNKRWFEIGQKQIVFFLYQLDELFNMKDICLRNRRSALNENTDAKTAALPKLQNKITLVDTVNLEKQLISLVDELKPRDLARVVSVMGKWRNRNQILLLAVVHRLSLANMEDFSLIQLSNLLFSCSILSLHNTSLLEKTVGELVNRDFSSTVLVSSILSSLSRLRWYDSSLVSKYLDYLADKIDGLSSQESWNTLMSLANLYTVPMSDKEVSVIKALGQRAFAEAKSSLEQVDTAWCLSILKLLDADMASTVLESSFIQTFYGGKSFQNINALQKLRHVNVAAQFEVDGYNGPFMEESIHNAESGQKKSAVHVMLASSLHNALGKFVDIKTYVRVSQSFSGGLDADAVMCAGSNGTPKPLVDLEEGGAAKDLHRIAIQVIPFKGVLTSHPTLCGIHQMTSRHLHHLGYTAVQIPYSGLRESQSVLEHVITIQSSIKKAIQNSSVSESAASSSPTV